MCDAWDTEEWNKKSKSAKANRMKIDSSGKFSRHTGGSIGYDEYRVRLRKALGREPTFKEIFLVTHLNKEGKRKLLAGELDVNNLEGMVFCTERAREAYEEYLFLMLEKYGPEFSDDDPVVWSQVVAKGHTKRVFGIGSSDLNYVVTGRPTSYEITRSSIEKQLQEKVCCYYCYHYIFTIIVIIMCRLLIVIHVLNICRFIVWKFKWKLTGKHGKRWKKNCDKTCNKK
ncbi:uncharacterized protein LOC143634712 [Bidens hawaiensis]|uniref:uncharacterized protein LOC143634712 n=1 Tax=Bidens hawaiensis TaxID=980011 RepID=UPI00404ADF46